MKGIRRGRRTTDTLFGYFTTTLRRGQLRVNYPNMVQRAIVRRLKNVAEVAGKETWPDLTPFAFSRA